MFKNHPKLRRRLFIAAAVVVCYMVIMMFGGCADKMILHPSTHPIQSMGAHDRRVEWQGGEIDIRVARSPGCGKAEPAAYVLEFIGNASRAEWVIPHAAERWGQRPVEVWAVNYPGYGQSTGPARLASISPSALAAYDALAKCAAGKPILIAGNSLGTAAALHVAANRPAAGLILQNPPALKELILGEFGWWNLWLAAGPIAAQIPSDLNSRQNAPRVNARALFLLATGDRLVKPKYQNMVADAYAGPKKIIEFSGGHNDAIPAEAAANIESALDWLMSGG